MIFVATSAGNILFVNDRADITKEVVEFINNRKSSEDKDVE